MSVPFLSSSVTCSWCRLVFLPPCKSAPAALMYGLCQTACDCHLPSFCALITTFFLFIHLRLTILCACAHGWGSSGFQADAEWQHLTRAAVSGQRAARIACILPVLQLPFLFFIYPSPTASCHNQVTPNVQESLKRETGKSGSSLLYGTCMLKHSAAAAFIIIVITNISLSSSYQHALLWGLILAHNYSFL